MCRAKRHVRKCKRASAIAAAKRLQNRYKRGAAFRITDYLQMARDHLNLRENRRRALDEGKLTCACGRHTARSCWDDLQEVAPSVLLYSLPPRVVGGRGLARVRPDKHGGHCVKALHAIAPGEDIFPFCGEIWPTALFADVAPHPYAVELGNDRAVTITPWSCAICSYLNCATATTPANCELYWPSNSAFPMVRALTHINVNEELVFAYVNGELYTPTKDTALARLIKAAGKRGQTNSEHILLL